MKYAKFKVRIERYLLSISSIERRSVQIIASVVALLSVILLIYEYVLIRQYANFAVETGLGVIIDYTLFWRRIRIAFVLLFNCGAIWSLKASWFFLSLLALVWIIIEYVLWYTSSLKGMESAGIERLPEPNTMGLYEATQWDIAVLVMATVLLAWSIKTLIASLVSTSASQPDTDEG